jgi:hypothetical protein
VIATRGGLGLASGLLALVLTACGQVPRVRLPQVEQATEAVHGSGERYRVHRDCGRTARSVDDMIRCMHDAGWEFVTRGPGYPESDCWQSRDRDDLDHIVPLCFVRASATP